jgi:hypothetical protein
MVAREVTPPRLDLANEDIIRAHMHAIWLAETGLNPSQAATRGASCSSMRRQRVARVSCTA